jgi:putative hydrolase of the HAD superfamily
MQVKNIIFDFGGIFIDIYYKKTEQAFIDAGVTHFPQLYNQHHASSLFEDLETGRLTAEAFCETFRKVSGVALPDKAIETAWNAMLGDFKVAEIEWLQTIKNRYNIYLYSNTNQIHHNHFAPAFEQQFGYRFDDVFIKAWYSHDVGLRKPYAASYDTLLQQAHLQAAETLFIDDTLVNVKGAREAGLQAIHLELPQSVIELNL